MVATAVQGFLFRKMTGRIHPHKIFEYLASALGLILVAFGIWALGGAIYYAWGLFDDPDGIADFARYFFETTKIAAHFQQGAEGAAHLVAWFVVVLLLLVLGKLGDWAISAGSRLLK